MCDYSLHSVRIRSAKVGEKLVTYNFGTGTRGFAAPEDCPRERERIERGSEHGHAAHALPCLRRERQCRCRAVHI